MKRKEMLKKLTYWGKSCDIVVIGGGASGLGIAVDAASRGYRVALFECMDFAKGTSSRSTKLVHGGVRYLAQGDVAMVSEALHERGRMKKNAPHLVRDMRFIIGNYRWWELPFYAIGLTCYDILAGKLGLGRSLPMGKKSVMREIAGLKSDGLRAGVVYHDGQFDDSRMAISLAQTAVDYEGVLLNYAKVKGVRKGGDGRVCGVDVEDLLTGEEMSVNAKVVINATGVFVNDILKMEGGENQDIVRPSQGVHLVVDKKFLRSDSALMIPKTMDGRVLFGVPWHDKVVLGTTDTPIKESSFEPRALEEEVDFILSQAGQYLDMKPTREDVLSVFAGLRPLAAAKASDGQKTKEISRSHKIMVSESGLLTIIGGKWTTYRIMAEEMVDRAIKIGGLCKVKCKTKKLKIHGYSETITPDNGWGYVYGCDRDRIDAISAEPIIDGFPATVGHVIWAVREEMAQSVEDVLARRVRLLFLDARRAIEAAPRVAHIMAEELGHDAAWESDQVAQFTALAKGYIL